MDRRISEKEMKMQKTNAQNGAMTNINELVKSDRLAG